MDAPGCPVMSGAPHTFGKFELPVAVPCASGRAREKGSTVKFTVQSPGSLRVNRKTHLPWREEDSEGPCTRVDVCGSRGKRR